MCTSIMVMLISMAFQHEQQSCFGICSLVFREIQAFVLWNFFISDDIIDAYSKLQNQQYPFIFKAQGADFAKRSK